VIGVNNQASGANSGNGVLGANNQASGNFTGNLVVGLANQASGAFSGNGVVGINNQADGLAVGNGVLGVGNAATGTGSGNGVVGVNNYADGLGVGNAVVGFSNQAQVTIFKYSDGPLIPPSVKQVYLTNNTWDIGKNYFGEVALFGDIKSTLPLLNDIVRANPPPAAGARNARLRELAAERRVKWDQYLSLAMQQEEIWAVVVADALRREIQVRGLGRKFVYVHEAVSDPAPFQYLLPLGTEGAEPISYYCVGGGSLGWSMPASLASNSSGTAGRTSTQVS